MDKYKILKVPGNILWCRSSVVKGSDCLRVGRYVPGFEYREGQETFLFSRTHAVSKGTAVFPWGKEVGA